MCHLLAACLLVIVCYTDQYYTVDDSVILLDDLSYIEEWADQWMMIFNVKLLYFK